MLDAKNLGEFAECLARGVGHRAELAGIELAEARDTTIASAMLFLAAGALFLLSGIAFTALVVAACWNTGYRLPCLAALGILYGLAGYGLMVRARTRMDDCHLLPETTDQLKKDIACLEEIIHQ